MIEAFDRLVRTLSRLPGIGRRSAERIATRLAMDPSHALSLDLSDALEQLRQQVHACSRCGMLTETGQDPCRLCTDARRRDAELCVVLHASDIGLIEGSGAFRGRYHALGAKLSPSRGEGLPHLHLDRLARRLDSEPVREVILAFDTDVESDATASFLKEWLEPRGLRVSRLAFGLPAGSGIAYSDPLTLARALEGRRDV